MQSLVSMGMGLHMQRRSPAQGGGVVPAVFTMTQLAASKRVYQRSTKTGGGQGKGRGTVTVGVNVTGAGSIYARIRAEDGSTILQAPWLVSDSVASGTLALPVPNVDARLGWFYLDLSPEGTTWQNGTVLIGMGVIIAGSGQSLMVRMMDAYDYRTLDNQGIVSDPNGTVYATYQDNTTVLTPAWEIPSTSGKYKSLGVVQMLKRMIAASGVNCAFVGHSRGATSISQYVPGGSENAKLRAVLDAVGGFEAFMWLQGHGDAVGGATKAGYKSALTTLFNDVSAHNALLGANYTKLISTIPNIEASTWGTPAQIMVIRNAGAEWSTENGATHVPFGDVNLYDQVHPSFPGCGVMAEHFYRALRPSLGLSGDDVGPSITGGTRSGVAITLNVSLPFGATSLIGQGDPSKRIKVFAEGDFSTALAYAATTPITVGINTITLRLAVDPGAVALDVYAYPPILGDPLNGSDDVSELHNVYDDHTDGDGIARGRQLVPSLAPVRIAA